MKTLKRLIVPLILFALILSGCGISQKAEQVGTITEQDIKNAITDLFNGINNGNIDMVEKYVGVSGTIAEQLMEKLKGNIKVSNIRDVKIEGTTAKAVVTVEVVPLKIQKDITLNFDITKAIMLTSPLKLLTLFM